MKSGCYKSVIIIQSKYDYDRASPAGLGSVQEELFQGGRIGNARIEWKVFWGCYWIWSDAFYIPII